VREAEEALVAVGGLLGGQDEGQAVAEADRNALQQVQEHEEQDVGQVLFVGACLGVVGLFGGGSMRLTHKKTVISHKI